MDITQHGNSLRIYWQGRIWKSSRPFGLRHEVVTNVNKCNQEIFIVMQKIFRAKHYLLFTRLRIALRYFQTYGIRHINVMRAARFQGGLILRLPHLFPAIIWQITGLSE
jgi:hypothetical protein